MKDGSSTNWVPLNSDHFNYVQEHPSSLSIADDDICSDCEKLQYCPGDKSLCKEAEESYKWPGEFDGDGRYVSCSVFAQVKAVDKINELCKTYLVSKGFELIVTDYPQDELWRKVMSDGIVISAHVHGEFFTLTVDFGKGNGGTTYLQKKTDELKYDHVINAINSMRVDGLDI